MSLFAFILGVIAAIVYLFRGVRLSEQATIHLKSRDQQHWAPVILRPELFWPDGEPAPARAVAFWNRWGLNLLLYFIGVFAFA